MKLLILSITAGQGHHQTGLAVANYFEENAHQVTQLDCYEYLSPAMKDMVSHGYLVSTKYSPKLYGKMYRLAEKADKTDHYATLFQLTNTLFHHKMARYLEEAAPDAVVCTHVFAAILMSYLAEKGYYYPTVGIITDFKAHPYWESTRLDYYVTPNEFMIPSLIKKGIRKEQILPIGIPIFQKFSQKTSKEAAREALQIDNIPTILVMSGSMGFGNVYKILQSIDAVMEDFQLITVCGNNEKLYKKIQKKRWKHTVHNFGYINFVDKLMDAADYLVTKPGGLTVSEALAKELPMLISKPIPGQEERNLEFLLNFGCCMRISKTSPADEIIAQLMMNPKKTELMLENVKILKKPDSTKQLYEHIMNMISKQKEIKQ
ncbi:MAG: galactosyldiacylglycerol synthase [Clostridia bacterium]|nr:galactosyldiacylglycerol synthase [Clostridia bacterium]